MSNENFDDIQVELPGSRANKVIPQRKLDYGAKLKKLLDEYDTCLIVSVTNVGSKQIAEMRKDLRGRARFLFGKNTLIRKVIRDYVKETGNKKFMPLMEAVTGNCGFVFTKGSIPDLRKDIISRKKQCDAKAGQVAPVDVFVPAGPTGMQPTETAFFQAMNIPTRINRSQIDIEEEVHLVFKDTKVGASEAILLKKMGIRPFYYGMVVEKIFQNGEVIDASVLDITPEQIAAGFHSGLRQAASLCFTIDYPTIMNVPHSLINSYKEIVALGLQLGDGYTWENLDLVKKVLENPGIFAQAAPAAGGGNAAPEEPKEPTPEPESSAAPNPMFGGDDSSSEEESD